jgi:hypothetical protein
MHHRVATVRLRNALVPDHFPTSRPAPDLATNSPRFFVEWVAAIHFEETRRVRAVVAKWKDTWAFTSRLTTLGDCS